MRDRDPTQNSNTICARPPTPEQTCALAHKRQAVETKTVHDTSIGTHTHTPQPVSANDANEEPTPHTHTYAPHTPRAHTRGKPATCSCRDQHKPAALSLVKGKDAPLPTSPHATHRRKKTHLGVLVDENERVRHVPVSQVHHAQPHPRAALGLDYSQDSPHLLAHRRALLDSGLNRERSGMKRNGTERNETKP